jgi:CBS-domain-containing membrane protein
MTEKQVEDLFVRYDVRALPVVDDNNDVIGLVTYKEVAAAKQRLWNKEQKRLRQEMKAAMNEDNPTVKNKKKKNASNKNFEKNDEKRKLGSALKGWMKHDVKTVEAGLTMAEVEAILLENDVGCIPVVADGTKQLVGMVTRTDLLRQHRYYPSLHYHNPGFSDSIAARKPIIELRKKLKKFDLDE